MKEKKYWPNLRDLIFPDDYVTPRASSMLLIKDHVKIMMHSPKIPLVFVHFKWRAHFPPFIVFFNNKKNNALWRKYFEVLNWAAALCSIFSLVWRQVQLNWTHTFHTALYALPRNKRFLLKNLSRQNASKFAIFL